MIIPKFNDLSSDVGELQRALIAHGAFITIDNEFGNETQIAVAEFQKLNGMTGSGKIGPKTMALLGLEITEEDEYGDTDTISSGTDEDEGTKAWYRKMFYYCMADHGYQIHIDHDAKKLVNNNDRYKVIEERLKQEIGLTVPWYIIGCIHKKEASFDFRAVLHNGQKFVGTNKKTTIVPKGKGPFATFEDAAVDALKPLAKRINGDYEIGNLLRNVEKYNGWGYVTGRGKSETSPYLWARTNVNDGQGKYVSDGKFSPTATTQKSSGVCAILKSMEMSSIVKINYGTFDKGSVDLTELLDKLDNQDSGLHRTVIAKALSNIKISGIANNKIITIVDYTKKSDEYRLFQLNLLTYNISKYRVGHSINSDEDGYVKSVSNEFDSLQSCKGVAITLKELASAKHGRALALIGVDATNSNMLKRGCVLHGGLYAEDFYIENKGGIGLTPCSYAVSQSDLSEIISKAGEGSLWYTHYDK